MDEDYMEAKITAIVSLLTILSAHTNLPPTERRKVHEIWRLLGDLTKDQLNNN
jgi:hypothetical protein